ncbi:MAG: cyclic nucleotide-binding domain-containing protein [Gammaproteobacteria bacterium]|nr:cyclic nucleotide-binding domain-containing protein [Gammaproteobacteria bacterium]MDH5653392.1 cyclic nucleotide-binding domain-containing protein [Gammaproteobacteria bacterium]
MTKRSSSLWSNLFRKRNPVTEHIIEMWSTTPLFRDIPKREILQLVCDMPSRSYAENEYIFHAGDQGAGAAIILSGKVQIRSGDVLLAELTEGDFFGEIALVLDVPRTADAIAVMDTELIFFLRPELEDWLSRSPYFAGRLGSNLAYVLAQRLIQANKALEQAGHTEQL